MLNIFPSTFVKVGLTFLVVFSVSSYAQFEKNYESSQCDFVKSIANEELQKTNLSISNNGVSQKEIEKNIKKGLIKAQVAHQAVMFKLPIHVYAASVYKEQCADKSKLASVQKNVSKT